jgi:hypothetical protein
MGWLVLNLLECLGGFSTKYSFFNKCEVFFKYLSQREFLKGKGRIFWTLVEYSFLGMESLKLFN